QHNNNTILYRIVIVLSIPEKREKSKEFATAWALLIFPGSFIGSWLWADSQGQTTTFTLSSQA
ncbi:MAG TPA: hypothetical protein VFN35_22985, partial [Ktedonobacteraceae bacterium]|nr:hypothetical protein [Ktedonobacteraceae bacterium]